MLLKQYESIGFREFDLEEFKQMLDVEAKSYDDFKRFRSRVINQAKKEFETKNKASGGYQSDITFDLETIRTGRKITRLRFSIRKQRYQERLPIDLPDTGVREVSADPAREALERYGIKDPVAARYLEQQDEAEILRCINILEQAKGAGKVKSSESGYLLKLLKARAGQVTEAERQVQQKKQQQEAQSRQAAEQELRSKQELRLSNNFFKAERKQWLASLSITETSTMLVAARKSLGDGFSSAMVKDLESPLITAFVTGQIPDYAERRAAHIRANMEVLPQ